MAKLDESGSTIEIGEDGLVRIDGIIVFRRVYSRGRVVIQFCDHDRLRSSCRGTRYVEIPMTKLVEILDGHS